MPTTFWVLLIGYDLTHVALCSDMFWFIDLRDIYPISFTHHPVAQLSFVPVISCLCNITEGYLNWNLSAVCCVFVTLGTVHMHTTHSPKTYILYLQRNLSWDLRSCKTFFSYSMNELLYSRALKVKCTEEKNFFIKMQFILIKQITCIWWNVKLGAPHVTKSPVGLFWQVESVCNR